MHKWIWMTVGLLWLAVGCGSAESEPAELVLMTHDSFAISEAVLAEFEEANNVTVQLLPAGDAGAALNQLILSGDEPLADVFYGVDNTFMGRALDADIFSPYEAGLGGISAEFDLDSSNRLTPINYGDVCLNYDIAWFAERGLTPPDSLQALADPAYAGLLVAENPATSSPGLAFLLATVAQFGTDGAYTWLDYWADLVANDVLITDGWSDAYYGQFTVYDGGRPLVVSYASSPPAEVYYSEGALDAPPTASVTAAGTCFRQVEFAGVVAGTDQPELAGALIDFMLSDTFQADIPLNMFVFPVNPSVALPEVFVAYAAQPDQPATMAPTAIDAQREAWIQAWTDTVLR